jgi:MOSC domain-containing protein YiiM
MYLISVNIGESLPIRYANGDMDMTGIWKVPSTKPVEITPEGLTGDHVLDVRHHAGPDQAVYVYGAADYVWWSQPLGRELAPGTFGDNLTISDLESASLNIGDRLRVGAVVLEVTAPRIPCRTLATRMVDPAFVKKFKEGERPGVYCRVIVRGKVAAGDPVSIEPYQGETISVLEMYRIYYDSDASEADIRRILAAPIAIRARRDNEERLEKILARAI